MNKKSSPGCPYIRFKTYFRILCLLLLSAKTFAQSEGDVIATTSGKYSFSYNQTPDNIVALTPVTAATIYYWEQNSSPDENTFTTVSAAPIFSFSSPLTQTMWYRRRAVGGAGTTYSNTIKIELVSVNWENINYVREHNVLISMQSDWKVIDQLPIGDKLQTTTYMDGLGRAIQKVSRETATPGSNNNVWGDIVQFSVYDNLGREPKQYLPYTTTIESGKFKSSPLTVQEQYYSSTLNETNPYSTYTFDFSPLNRVKNIKSPGYSWNNNGALGNSADLELNEPADNVRQFTIGYNAGDAPVDRGPYPVNTLFKKISKDENNKQVVEYTNSSGQVILTKTQVDEIPSSSHDGWICVYSIYDDFGLLRYRLQPEAVKYLDTHNWSFEGADGQQVLNELCFRYEYDDKGRNILKKAPGAKELNIIYDQRDRIVFMQDGNQRLKSEWTTNLYDDLDRVIITTLYHTTKTVTQLQTDITNATNNIISINYSQPVIDLVVPDRDISVSRYAASNSIEFTDGFSSAVNDDFIAEIDPTAATTNTINSITYNNPISNSDLYNAAVSTIVKHLFYDDYSFGSVKSFDNNFDNNTAYSTSVDVIPITKSNRTLSFPTGAMVRVLGTNTFLTSTEYYDEKGRHIQTLEDNIKSGRDVTTMQYHWDGRLLSTHSKHTTSNSGYSGFSILTKNIFDKIGRVISIQKKYGSNDFKTIADYDLDDIGRLKVKHLDPGYTGSGKNEMESLAYSYNIHNDITGINKDYALKTNLYNKWSNFFGLYVGYDNRDNIFNTGKIDGHVTGLLWNTMGDDAQRRYDYLYDNAGRLIRSDFKEKKSLTDSWDNSKMDFTVGGSGVNNSIQYDLNGNLQSMFQKGVVIGNNMPLVIDNMQYNYTINSNKLIRVTDNGNAGAANGKLGDFTDGTNGSADDYVYDDDGNLVIDLNKNAKDLAGYGGNGIRYNFLDKPEEIHISGKGTIQIIYDADGNKLQKKYTQENTTNTTTTTYINEFVYTGDVLSYINFEEGRIRVVTPVSQSNTNDGLAIDGNMILPNGKRGTYDFFIRDYQQNVRMILTEEVHTGYNTCTMETDRSGAEEPYFGQSGSNNEVSQTRKPKPAGWTSNSSVSVSKLSAGALDKKAGPNVLLKVMAGDVITATTQYYFQNNVTNGTGDNLTGDILATLAQSILGSNSTGLAKTNTTNITNQLGLNASFTGVTAPDANNSTVTTPKAYMTVLFFDERFNFVTEGSTAKPVTDAGDGNHVLVIDPVKSPKNGYAYVYLSNESNEPVYFDNFKVQDNRGRIIEEDHYYSFGLKIADISSRKLGDPNEGGLQNPYQYQGSFSTFDDETGYNDFQLRNYDAQLARWIQPDPYNEFPSQYTGMGNNPVSNVDPDGGCVWCETADKALTLEEVVVTAVRKAPAAAGSGLFSEIAGAAMRGALLSLSSYAVSIYNNNVAVRNQNEANKIWAGDKNEIQLDRHLAQRGIIDADAYMAGYNKFAQVQEGILSGLVGEVAIGRIFGVVDNRIGNLKIPIYRVYGEGASMYGKSYSVINPKYVPFYRNFAGLPNANSGQYLLKGSIPFKDIRLGRWLAAPADGNTGGLPFELYQNYDQLINPANVILKKPF